MIPSERPDRASTRRLQPDLLAERRHAERWERDLRVPETLDCWPGHFPDWAVVPGVLQLDWVMACLADVLGRSPCLARIEGLKFKRPLGPGVSLTLTLEREPGGSAFRFVLADPEHVFCQGRLALSPATVGP